MKDKTAPRRMEYTMSVKFSNAQIAAIKAAGTPKGNGILIPLVWFAEIAPTRTRTSADERQEKFNAVVNPIAADDKGVKRVNVLALLESGLAAGSVANPAYWSGIGDGSCMAFELGFKSKHVVARDGASLVMTIVLSPLTDADRAKHAKSLTKAEQKAADKKAAAKAAGEDADEGDAVEDTEGGDEGTETAPSDDGVSPEATA